MAYKDIVNINITRQTTSVSVAAFNVPLILSTFASGASGTPSTFTRAKSYGSPKALEDDGWSTTGVVYKMANAIFSQNPTVNRIVVGRADSGDATVAASLNAICDEENSWYGLVVDPAMVDTTAKCTAIAAWIESAKKFSIIWTANVDCYDGTKTTDPAYTLKDLGYDRTAVIFHAVPSTGADYPDGCAKGSRMPRVLPLGPTRRLRESPPTTSRPTRKRRSLPKIATSIPK